MGIDGGLWFHTNGQKFEFEKMVNDQYSSNYDLNPALLWRQAAQAERRESRFENLTFFHF